MAIRARGRRHLLGDEFNSVEILSLDRIFTKLNVHTRTEAALLYTQSGEKMESWE